MNEKQCEGPNCDISFEPGVWNQKYHAPECKREAENQARRNLLEQTLQSASQDTGNKTSVNKPRVLLLDIETSPNLVYSWGLWDQNIGLSQIKDTSKVICLATKWLGSPKVSFTSIQDGHDVMVKNIWALLDQADAVIHYNGSSFDIPHLNREFLEAKLGPPSPYQNIDLYRVIKKFKFQSRKLDHVSQQLGLEGKVKHEGFQLWLKCLDGDPKAWKAMEKYNRRDVTLMEDLYTSLLPWIPNLPNHQLYDLDAGCPRCGSSHVQRRGISRTATSIFQQYQCQECMGWFKETKKAVGVDFKDMASC